MECNFYFDILNLSSENTGLHFGFGGEGVNEIDQDMATAPGGVFRHCFVDHPRYNYFFSLKPAVF